MDISCECQKMGWNIQLWRCHDLARESSEAAAAAVTCNCLNPDIRPDGGRQQGAFKHISLEMLDYINLKHGADLSSIKRQESLVNFTWRRCAALSGTFLLLVSLNYSERWQTLDLPSAWLQTRLGQSWQLTAFSKLLRFISISTRPAGKGKTREVIKPGNCSDIDNHIKAEVRHY